MINNKKLYIIGNGFDLYHGIPSAYSNFKSYVENVDFELFDQLNYHFNEVDLWSNFESNLEHINIEEILLNAEQYLEHPSNEDWSESMNHDYQFEIDQVVKLVTVRLKEHFTNWILSLKIENHNNVELLPLDRNSRFLCFNYTNTLESLYNIPSKNILFIHNKAIDKKSNLILGHSRNPKKIKTEYYVNGFDKEDFRIEEGNTIINQYYNDTFKKSDEIIKDNIKYFEELKTLEEIIVIGHSLSQVDIKYYEKIISSVNVENISWKISYHVKKDIPEFLRFLINIGLKEEKISFHETNNIEVGDDPNQLKLFE